MFFDSITQSLEHFCTKSTSESLSLTHYTGKKGVEGELGSSLKVQKNCSLILMTYNMQHFVNMKI